MTNRSRKAPLSDPADDALEVVEKATDEEAEILRDIDDGEKHSSSPKKVAQKNFPPNQRKK
jgi:hypothetical protein